MRTAFSLSRLAVLLAAIDCTTVNAQDAETFYKSHNKLTIGTAGTAGGGYDAYARLLGRHISAHMPGAPTVVIQNIPAAGGLQIANMVYNTGPKDGTFLGEVRGSVVQEHLFGNIAAMFDGRRFGWIGNLNVDRDGCIVQATSGVKSIKDFYTREVIVGGTGVGVLFVPDRLQ